MGHVPITCFVQVLYFLLREKHKSYSLLEDRRVRNIKQHILKENQPNKKISENDELKSTNQSLTNFAPLQSPVSGVKSRKQMVFNWWGSLKLVPQMKHI